MIVTGSVSAARRKQGNEDKTMMRTTTGLWRRLLLVVAAALWTPAILAADVGQAGPGAEKERSRRAGTVNQAGRCRLCRQILRPRQTSIGTAPGPAREGEPRREAFGRRPGLRGTGQTGDGREAGCQRRRRAQSGRPAAKGRLEPRRSTLRQGPRRPNADGRRTGRVDPCRPGVTEPRAATPRPARSNR